MVRGFKRENPDDPWCLRTSNELRVRKHSSTFLGLTQYLEDKKDAGEGDMKIHWKYLEMKANSPNPPQINEVYQHAITVRAPQQLRNSQPRSTWIHLDPPGSTWIHLDPPGSTWIHLATAAPSLDQSFSLLSSDSATHPWWMTEAFGPTSQVSRCFED